jgi:hypothetical protein
MRDGERSLDERRMGRMAHGGCPGIPGDSRAMNWPRRAPARPRRLVTAALLGVLGFVCLALPASALALGRAPVARPEVGIEDQNVIFGPTAGAVVPQWRAMGVDSVRVQAYWDALSPNASDTTPPPGFNPADPNDSRYKWAPLDQAIGLVLANGMGVNLTINQCNPRWASDEPSVDQHCWRPNPQLFAQFAGAVARRYGGSIHLILLGSEPNQASFLQPQFVCSGGCVAEAPNRYRDLVNAAYPAVKAGAGGVPVLIGELAPIGSPPSPTSGVKPLTFIRQFACVDKKLRPIRTGACANFVAPTGDAIGYHPYVNNRKSPTFQIKDPDIAKIGDIPRLLKLLDTLSAKKRIRPSHGRRFSVYFTEYGYITNPPNAKYGVSLRKQVLFNAQSAYRVWQFRSRIKLLSQYLWSDDPTFNTGLLQRDGTPKPALFDFPHPFFIDQPPRKKVRKGKKFVKGPIKKAIFWGQVRPDGQRLVQLQMRKRGSSKFKTIKRVLTDAGGYWVVKMRSKRGASYRYLFVTTSGPGTSIVLPAPPVR